MKGTYEKKTEMKMPEKKKKKRTIIFYIIYLILIWKGETVNKN